MSWPAYLTPQLARGFAGVTDSAANLCSRNIEMTPLCKIEVTLPRVLGFWGVRHGGGVDEQTGVQSP